MYEDANGNIAVIASSASNQNFSTSLILADPIMEPMAEAVALCGPIR
jgi:hypothetical protein